MERALWMGAGAALVLMTGCAKQMSYAQLDATKANAEQALSMAGELDEKVTDLETKVSDLEDEVAELRDDK